MIIVILSGVFRSFKANIFGMKTGFPCFLQRGNRSTGSQAGGGRRRNERGVGEKDVLCQDEAGRRTRE